MQLARRLLQSLLILSLAWPAAQAAARAEVIAEQISPGTYDADLVPALEQADIVFEALTEDMALKREFFAMVDRYRNPASLVATNSSGLSIAGMSRGFSDSFRRNFLGIHTYNPPHILVATEVIPSPDTDPEVLEWRFPVLLERFEIRKGSGGAGRHRGGDGVIRRFRFREQMTAAILSNHRRIAPFGLDGGDAGALGRNWVERANGDRELLSGAATAELNAGDVFVLETPGGGGFGTPAAVHHTTR